MPAHAIALGQGVPFVAESSRSINVIFYHTANSADVRTSPYNGMGSPATALRDHDGDQFFGKFCHGHNYCCNMVRTTGQAIVVMPGTHQVIMGSLAGGSRESVDREEWFQKKRSLFPPGTRTLHPWLM